MSVKLKPDIKMWSNTAFYSYLFHIGKAENVNFLNNGLTRMKKAMFEQC